MSDAKFTIDVEGNIFKAISDIRKDTGKLKGDVSEIQKTSKSSFSNMQKHIANISFVSITQGLENTTRALSEIAGPGLNFETSMADLSAITGLTGDKLDELGEKARANAKIFGGDAAKSVDTFKLILSQLGPVLADHPETLDLMAKNSEKLAKTMGGDVVGATNVLTTAMNQYKVDLTDAAGANKVMTEMMNSMAASAKEGSSELPVLQAAVKNVGGDAMRSNVKFEEMLSSIQLLDKAGKKGAEGGIALRNVLATLNQGRFLPKDVQEELAAAGVNVDALSDKSLSFTDRLRNLESVSGDAALMSKLFGRETQGAAQSLIQSIDQQEEMTVAITGTNTAMEQAEVMMDTGAEKQARMMASIDDFKVSVFQATGGVFAYLEPISDVARQMSAFVPIASAAASGVKYLGKSKIIASVATKAVTAAQWLWNAAMTANPIGLLIAGVVALGAGIYALSNYVSSGTNAQKAANAVHERAVDIASEEIAETTILTNRIKAAKEGTDERRKAIEDLKKEYPDLLKMYTEEQLTNEKIDEIQGKIADNAMLRARKEVAAEIYKEKLKEQVQAEQKAPGWYEMLISLNSLGVISSDDVKNVQVNEAAKESNMALQESMKADKAYEDAGLVSSSKNKQSFTDNNSVNTDPVTGGGASIPNRDKVIQGSGGEMKTINVRIENLVKNITLSTTNLSEGTGRIKQQVTEAMVAAVRDFEVAM